MLSFGMNFSVVYDTASTIINGLGAAYLLPLGVALGVGIIGVVVVAIRSITIHR